MLVFDIFFIATIVEKKGEGGGVLKKLRRRVVVERSIRILVLLQRRERRMTSARASFPLSRLGEGRRSYILSSVKGKRGGLPPYSESCSRLRHTRASCREGKKGSRTNGRRSLERAKASSSR